MKEREEQPTVGEQAVPRWIKIMWFFGVLWMLIYAVTTLNQSPFQ